MDQLKDVELKEIVKELRIRGRSRMRKAEKIQALREMGINTNEDLEIYRQIINEEQPIITTPPTPVPGTPPGYPQPTLIPETPPPNSIKIKPKPRKNIIKRKLAPTFIKPQKPSNKTFNWGNYSFKVMDKDVFYKKLTDLTNENIIKLTNNKPRKNVNISDSVRDELDEKQFNIEEQQTALRGYLKTYRIGGKRGYGPKIFLNNIKPKVIDLINKQKKPIKIKFIFTCKFIKKNPATRQTDENSGYFHSTVETITSSTDLSELFNMMTNRLLEKVEKFQNEGSGWQFNQVEYFDINIDPFEPFVGSSYINLPQKLATKKAIINVRNENDHECFKWAVTSAVYKQDIHPERKNKEMVENSKNFNWSGIEFPTSLKQIDRFEKQNPYYTINVYGYDKDDVYPLRISKKQKGYLINLLLISEDENNHYCWIKNMSRLLAAKVSKHKSKMHFCPRCLNAFQSEKSLEKHLEYCGANKEVKIDMPKDEDGNPKYIKFNNYNRKMRVPFVVYADFESFPEKIHTCSPDESESYTNQYQKHKASGFSYLIKSFDDKIFPPELVQYTAESPDDDIPQIFVNNLEQDIKKIYNKTKYHKKVEDMSEMDKKEYENATHCHICEEKLGEDKVLDHCHLTGKYRGAAHNECNLNYKIPKFFPVIFHNLSGYDAHIFIKNLGVTEGKINCIPNNEEKYISFTKQIVVDEFTNKEGKHIEVKRDIRFIDSFKFMSTSLEKLVVNLPKESFKNLNIFYEGEELKLLLRKGVFPYDWFDGLDKLSTNQLPPKDAFYSILNDENISDNDYKHAQNVWETFNMETMRDYHDLYLNSDVLLLADVFENFRDVCSKNYGLDPAHYYTAPGLAWDAALKITKVNLELLTDIDMLLMIEKGIRGGVSMISTRYGKANNPYMKNFDINKIISYIIYLDANNLYGGAMSRPLPTHGFRWMNEKELTYWKNMPCILEVDLEYPTHLHDLHNDYPLAPERLLINKVEKLIPNLNNRVKYVVHYETLKLYESFGLKVTKIHRGITFEESAWLEPYIKLNTDLRAKGNNDFEKDFFKLMNNSVFGKTMENIRNRVDIKLVTNEKDAKKLISKPNYQHRTIFCENLVAIHMKKTKLVFNKPVYLGMCILDLSKTIMYDFHYNYIKPKYEEKAKLLFTDTDSLAYYIETEDFYKDISPDVWDKFDTSNFPENHKSGIETNINKKVINMFKDEAGGEQIAEFVGLRAKLYSYRMDEGEEEKKCKGMKKVVVKKTINFVDYKRCLFNKEPQMRKMNVIRSRLHDVYTETVNKAALSADDDKRIICKDGINTFAIGHHRFKTESGGSSVS